MSTTQSVKKNVYLSGPIFFALPTFERLSEKYNVKTVELKPGVDLSQAHALLVKGMESVKKELIDLCPNLQVVARHGVGYENVDVAYCISKNIWVTNTPDVIANATADIALLHLLNVSRRFSEAERQLRSGSFPIIRPGPLMGHDPEGTTLGILGMGTIGKRIAKRAAAFEMKILYYNRNKLSAEEEKQFGNATYVTKDELLKNSDYISVNVAQTPATHHFLDVEDFNKMKTGVVIINTARGPIINEQALVDALKQGKVGGAGLDVFEQEPKVHPELLTLPNVSLTPHIGTATVESRRAMEELSLRNVEAVLDGHNPLNPVPEFAKHRN